MPGETVLIIEDDPAMLEGLKGNFEFEGYAVETAADGEAGLKAALDGRPDLIVLDIMLPAINGYEVCRLVRGAGLDVPIIMLTAKGQEADIVLGLEVGADDYVTKPFGIMELLARANALLRRRRREEPDVYRFGEFELDTRALTRNQILNAVWGHSAFVTRRSVDQCVNTLRAKIEPPGGSPRHIRTVRGVRYRFDAAPKECSD